MMQPHNHIKTKKINGRVTCIIERKNTINYINENQTIYEERPSNLKKHYKNSNMKLLVIVKGIKKEFQLFIDTLTPSSIYVNPWF